MKTILRTLLAAGLLAASAASAEINIPTVQIGDPGNLADPLNSDDIPGIGSVSYEYHIGTHEVTNAQYTAFLNSVAASDPHSLYNTNMGSSSFGGINRAGSSGSFSYSVKSGFENKPVNFVSFWDAARFSNWLTTGGTETGVYNLNGTTAPTNNTITRDATAWANGGVAIASENEWYKAAYYDGNGGYTLYPTQSNTAPTGENPPGGANSANFSDGPGTVGTVTDVGAYTNSDSHYGTFDQGGNVWDWNDTIVATTKRGLRGGSFLNFANSLPSSSRYSDIPSGGNGITGFRVSSLAPIGMESTSNTPPVAVADFTIIAAQTGEVEFDASGSSDIDGTIASYVWSWDGGSANGVNPTVTLPESGTTVTLVVTDDEGATGQLMFAVSIPSLTTIAGEAGLTGDDALPGAIPFDDGVPNLLKYAFNMELDGPDSSTLAPGGDAGLPAAELDASGEFTVWRVEFVRRKASGLTYTPQISTTLEEGSFSPMTGTPSVTDIDDAWERVVVEEPYNPETTPSSFSRVEVEVSGE